jgi:hypothetical protein
MAKITPRAKGLHLLTTLQVKNARPGAKLSDGGGLRLDADARGGRSWVFRYKSPLTGKERYMGLGPAPAANTDKVRKGLADARVRADSARKLLRDGTCRFPSASRATPTRQPRRMECVRRFAIGRATRPRPRGRSPRPQSRMLWAMRPRRRTDAVPRW